MKITVVGAGYVGFSLALLLSKQNDVVILEKDEKKIELVKNGHSPVNDEQLIHYMLSNKPSPTITNDINIAYKNSDLAIIATPTNYNSEDNKFDVSTVITVAKDAVKQNPNIAILVKSTIPVGFIDNLKKLLKHNRIYFSPEFLREGKTIEDNQYPSRIIVGGPRDKFANKIANIFLAISKKKDVPVYLM